MIIYLKFNNKQYRLYYLLLNFIYFELQKVAVKGLLPGTVFVLL